MIIHAASDLHRQHLSLSRYLAKGDLLVLAGDYDCEDEESTYTFLKWCLKISKNYTYGIVLTAGNHDQYLADNLDEVRDFLVDSKVNLLINESLTLENGFKIFGSPNTEVIGSQYYCNAFCGTFRDLETVYQNLPHDLDLLITHCPPRGILDDFRGSIALANRPMFAITHVAFLSQ